ncbi:MAG TPA: hypothetical protein VM241_05110 [Candidatus Thermoplasmatota archaeon]|nr:hypothetical protein [Candidatus Thermoplasmatota archaeon]
MQPRQARKVAMLAAAVLLGIVWLVVAFLGRTREDFVLYEAFHDLGLLFWLAFTVLGLALVATLSWAFLSGRDEASILAPPAPPPDPATDRVKLTPAWNPMDKPSEERTHCLRCGRTLPIWRMPDGTCTVCAPFSVFLDKPVKPNPELDRRRTRLFILQGLGFALLALAFVSAVYLFPIVLAPQRPVIATLGFLVFSPLLFGLVLLMYAHSQHKPEVAE